MSGGATKISYGYGQWKWRNHGRTTVECDVPVPPEPRVLTPEEQAPPEAAVDTGVAAGSSDVPDDLPVAPAAGPLPMSEPPESVGAHPEHRSYPRRTRRQVRAYMVTV